jgi:hypothetical protein
VSGTGAEARLAELVGRLEAVRAELEAQTGDPDAVLALLDQVNELARELASELERARQAALDDGHDD